MTRQQKISVASMSVNGKGTHADARIRGSGGRWRKRSHASEPTGLRDVTNQQQEDTCPARAERRTGIPLFHEAVAGLVAVAAILTMVMHDGSSQSATISDPPRCVVQMVKP